MRNVRILLILPLLLLLIAGCSGGEESLRKRLTDYSVEFARDVIHSDDDVKRFVATRRGGVADSTAFRVMRQFGRDLYDDGHQAMAYEYFRNSLAILNEQPSLSQDEALFKTYCFLMIGRWDNEVGMNQFPIDYYLKGLNMAEELGTDSLTEDFYNNIGFCYRRAGDLDKSVPYLEKALEINEKKKQWRKMSVNYNNLSEVRLLSGDIDGAIEYAIKAVQCVDENTYPDQYYFSQTVLGSIYLKHGETGVAYPLIVNAYRHQKERGYNAALFETGLLLLEFFVTTGDMVSVKQYEEELRELVDKLDNPSMKVRLMDGLARLYGSQGDYGESYKLAMQSSMLKDSVFRAENLVRMQQAQDIYETAKKTLTEENAMEKWNPVVVFFAMGSIVVLLIALLVTIIMMKRRADKARDEKEAANASLTKLREEAIAQERLQREQAERDLNEQQRRLTAITLEKLKTSQQIDKALTDAKKVLLKLPQRDAESRQIQKGIIANLSGLGNDTDWEEFQHYFVSVHPDFYRRLDELHPDLTPKNRRLCALISLGLSTKEIASLTFREVRSIETSRNRLRRKLDLPADVNLEDYLRRLTSQ